MQLEYYLGPAFYSLKGISFTKSKQERMTHNHTVVPFLSSLSFIQKSSNTEVQYWTLLWLKKAQSAGIIPFTTGTALICPVLKSGVLGFS